ncbi:MAG: 30S ribosomal protein S20 [Patescibacteria group bacterium]
MPITTGAIRKLRADKKKQKVNVRVRSAFKQALVSARKKPTKEMIAKAFSLLDRAAKKSVIHKNKASRLKSRLSALVAGK